MSIFLYNFTSRNKKTNNMKLSELKFDEICRTLEDNKFCMHYDASDCLNDIISEKCLDSVRNILMEKYGDVEVSINPGANWWDEVKIEDEKWKSDHDEFNRKKQAWCDKYGCD